MDEHIPIIRPINAGAILSEPLSTAQLARLFKVNRNKMAAMLKQMCETDRRVERYGRLFRVPVERMSPAYLLSRGLMAASKLDHNAIDCTLLHKPSFHGRNVE